ncbi:MAG: hypothetical protein AAF569_04050 [Pseudomonadota bacterium]
MPYEERFINFNLEEVQQAVSIGCVKEGLTALPDGELTQIEIHDDDPKEKEFIYFHVKDKKGETHRKQFDRKFFALSLVFYCQGSGIPIPARGQKTLNIKPDHIVMGITLERKAFDG